MAFDQGIRGRGFSRTGRRILGKPSEIAAQNNLERTFEPQISADEAESRFAKWKQAVERCKNWES